MEISFLVLAIVVGAIIALYKYMTKYDFYFLDKPIPALIPRKPFGSLTPLVMKKVNMMEHFRNMYNEFPDAKIYGMYNMRQPAYILRDPEIVKQIAIKDFDHFADHSSTMGDSENSHMLLTNSLVALRGQKWRDMRATLSPAFTGSKMRQMFALIAECGQSMVEYFKNELLQNGRFQMELKETMSRFANDVIGSSAFGIKVDSFKDPNNQFYRLGRSVTKREGLLTSLKMIGYTLFPNLMVKMNIDFLSSEQNNFFRQTILDNMKTREEKSIFRPDMIELLMQAGKGNLRHQADETAIDEGFATVEESQVGRVAHSRSWTESELIAQAFIFFFAGFETISWTASFGLYELALAEDIKNHLYEEIKDCQVSLKGGEISYEKLQSLSYLDMVVSEMLRKWPIGTVLDRQCIRDYVYDDGQGCKFTIEKGRSIMVPIIGFHFDPKYFPNPERFDPERFNEENRKNITTGTYMPFGVGPRNCIGSRFALMELKAIMYYMLLNFDVFPYEKTQIPLKIKKSATEFATEQGIWLEFRSRT